MPGSSSQARIIFPLSLSLISIINDFNYLPIISLSDRKQFQDKVQIKLTPVKTPSCVLSHGIVVAFIRPFYNCLGTRQMWQMFANCENVSRPSLYRCDQSSQFSLWCLGKLCSHLAVKAVACSCLMRCRLFIGILICWSIFYFFDYIDLLEDNDGIMIILILHICDAEDLMSISCNLAVG